MNEKEYAKKILEQDIATVYLGNLKTVEFDLILPKEGKNGSKITWMSADERWIDSEGKVNRPEFGRGNRVVKLIGTFSYGGEVDQKIYDVRILEAENDVKLEKVFPVILTVNENKEFYLPMAVAIKTKDRRVISHLVEWGVKQPLKEIGEKVIIYSGFLQGTKYEVQAKVNIKKFVDDFIDYEVKENLFNLSSIQISEGTSMKKSQDQMLNFLLSVNDDQMLYNFRKTAGLDTNGAPEMIGWDSPDSKLRGHTTGHYLSALALAYSSTGNEKILKKLIYMIEEIAKVQDFIGEKSEFTIDYLEEQFDLLEKFVAYPDIWAPYYTLHKIFAGLLDSYRLANIHKALVIADKLGNSTYNRLSKLSHSQLQKMWSIYIAGEYGGMNDSFAELYTYTKKEIYLKAAKLFDNDRLFYPLEQKVDALGGLHANQHIPQIVGAMKIYNASKQERYYKIAKFFWDSIAEKHAYAMGGTGDGELFQQPNYIASHISKNTAETCASYNMLKLTKRLYQIDPQVKYLDYYEKVMINHILATSDHNCTGESTYFMATQPGAKRFFEVENSCCHGTGMENHFKYGTLMYTYNEQTVTINFFISSELQDEKTGIKLNIIANENQPENAIIKVSDLQGRSLRIRKPNWANNVKFSTKSGSLKVIYENGFYTLNGNFTEVELVFDISFRMESTPDNKNIFAIYYGPYLLVALHDSKKYLKLDVTPKTINNKMKKYPNKNIYSYDESIKFIPIYQLDDKSYHMYFKQ